MSEAERYLALDIGGTYVKFAVYKGGEQIIKGKIKTPESIVGLEDFLCREINEKIDVIAVSSGGFWKDNKGTGFQSIADSASGEWLKRLSGFFNAKAYIDNDAVCALRYELDEGSLRGVQNAAVVLLGSSFGCAVAIGSKIYNGASGQGARMFLMPERLDDGYVFDTYANSVKAVQRQSGAGAQNFKYIWDNKHIYENFNKEISDYTDAVALKIWYLILAFDLQAIAFGGAISSNAQLLEEIKEKIYEMANKLCPQGYIASPRFVLCEGGEDANLTGAVLLAKKEAK